MVLSEDLTRLMISMNFGSIDYIGYSGESSNFNPNFEKTVCDLLGISSSDLRSKDRRAVIVIGRRIVFNYLRDNTNMSLYEIGKKYDNHHATVMHHLKKYQELIEWDKPFRELVQKFESNI